MLSSMYLLIITTVDIPAENGLSSQSLIDYDWLLTNCETPHIRLKSEETRAVLSQGGPRDAAVNFDKKFTTASRGFCATAWLSCRPIVLHQRPFK